MRKMKERQSVKEMEINKMRNAEKENGDEEIEK